VQHDQPRDPEIITDSPGKLNARIDLEQPHQDAVTNPGKTRLPSRIMASASSSSGPVCLNQLVWNTAKRSCLMNKTAKGSRQDLAL
jgi:hypothetical protein